MPSQSTLLGAAGEHHLMAELLRRIYRRPRAARCPQRRYHCYGHGGVTALLYSSENAPDGGWHMKAKHENVRLFFCFVEFGIATDTRPVVHVLPSAHVADVLCTTHQQWLANPGRKVNP